MKTYMVVVQNRNTSEESVFFFDDAFVMSCVVWTLLDDEQMLVELYKRGAWGYERVNIADELVDVKMKGRRGC